MNRSNDLHRAAQNARQDGADEEADVLDDMANDVAEDDFFDLIRVIQTRNPTLHSHDVLRELDLINEVNHAVGNL